jgi:hypothetical protein
MRFRHHFRENRLSENEFSQISGWSRMNLALRLAVELLEVV